MILLDTDHCIFFIRGRADVVRAFEARPRETPSISIVTVGELYFGALRSARPSINLAKADAFIDRVTVVDLDRSVMLRFAELKAHLATTGRRLEDPDLLIAATALTHAVTLVTHNTGHFQRVEGLAIEDWCGNG